MVQSTGDGQPQTGDLEGLELVTRALNEPEKTSPPKGTTDSGADIKPEEPESPTPRTYSENEFRSLQSSLDKRISDAEKSAEEANARTARLVLDAQADRVQAMEAAARAADDRMVEDGDLTRQEANQRGQARVQSLRTATESRQREENLQRYEANLNDTGRRAQAFDLARQYGIEEQALLDDDTLTDPDKMEAKANRLSLDREREEFEATKREGRGEERFDGGGGSFGSATGVVADMSADEKIRHALRNPPKGSIRNR